ncbi:MAG: DUF1351 domain-containing protein [Clostridium sp.]|nr:DUF1351 domain-containing protein [Clostridium sp.]MCM1547938.1 DUF1351 domain-containing protein [Ruminococcus sp.]
MEIQILTDLNLLPSVIEFNYEELKSEISERLEYYKNLVVTEDGIKAAKADKAKLNKLITVIEDERKEIKKRCLEPYDSFEAKCKDLVSLIKAPVAAIDKQIKEFENIRDQKKYDELKNCFDNYIGDMADIIQFDKILNPKWKNVTEKTDKLKAEIEDNIDRIKKELDTLDTEYAGKPYKTAVISEYRKGYSMSKAMIYAAQLKYEDEMQKKARDRAGHFAHSPNAEIPIDAREENEAEQKVNISAEEILENPDSERLLTGTFKVSCTRGKLIALRDFMKENNIHFEVIR